MNLAVGTPMYGGMCSDIYRVSVSQLARALAERGHRQVTIGVGNESLIPRARNAIVWQFLRTDAQYLLWCDADIGFQAADVLRMLDASRDIIAAPVPLKTINWERVAAAARAGVPPEELAAYSGVFNLTYLAGGPTTISPNQPFEIRSGGTGLMLVKRDVYERLARTTEAYTSRQHGSAVPFDTRVHNFHPVRVDDIENGDLLPEDYGFCDLWRKAGGTVWAAPWARVRHAGSYAFSGVFSEVHKPLEER